MTEKKLKLTIDTNLINARQKLAAMNKLEQWRDEGKIVLVGAERLKREVSKHPLQPEANMKVEAIPNVSEPLVWGVSSWGEGYWADDDGPDFSQVASVMFPSKDYTSLSENEKNDVMHLMGHAHAECDIFVTNNTKDFINDGRREKLKARFGIYVATAEELVADFASKHGWK